MQVHQCSDHKVVTFKERISAEHRSSYQLFCDTYRSMYTSPYGKALLIWGYKLGPY